MKNNQLAPQPDPTHHSSQLRALFKQYLEEETGEKEIAWETLTTENGLPHNWIYDLFQGSDGRIYVGTWGGGLLVIQDEDWQLYNKKDGLYSDAVTSIQEDARGRVWLGTDSGLNILEKGKILDGGLAGKSLLNVLVDSQQNLWAGCWRAARSGGGLYRYDGNNWQSFSTRQNLPGQEILKIFEDSIGRIWVGTYEQGLGAGVGCYDGHTWEKFTTQNGLVSDCVYSMFEDPLGNMWFGTTRGISIFDGVQWNTLTNQDGLIDNRVYCMHIDSQKKFWFGTEKGVSRFDGKTWLSYTKKDGLVENLVRTILETDDLTLWFGTYPYARGRGGISIARFEDQGVLADRVLNLLPGSSSTDQLPPGENTPKP